MRNDTFHAFVDYDETAVPQANDGPLAGLRFAVKDLFDVKGYLTGCGHPLKREQSPIAATTAPAIQALLDAGAEFAGKTHTDELAYSLNGENVHYGTPINPAAPERVPGGSSSGSAVAVASEQVDFAIGTDTGGSIRIPASYCGIYGLRPTHDAISLDGAMPLAPSFDTLGWFTREATLLQAAGAVLLPPADDAPFTQARILDDTLALLSPAGREALTPALTTVESVFSTDNHTLAPAGFEPWVTAFRMHQGYEVAQCHSEWIARYSPSFGPGISERFAWTATISEEAFHQAVAERDRCRARLMEICPDNTVLVLPSAPGPAPFKNTPPDELEAFRQVLFQLLALSGLSGCPQLSLPVGTIDGSPLGLSLIARPGADRALLEAACRLDAALKSDQSTATD